MKLLKIVILCLLFWNIPFLLIRIFKFGKLKRWVRSLEPHSKQKHNLSKEKSLGDLPSEVLLKIFFYCGILEIYRLGSTCKSLFQLSKDDVLWEKKFFWDFHSKSSFKKLNLNYKTLYKSRYLLTESALERDLRLGVGGIIDSEFSCGLVRSWHLVLIPLKVFGFLSVPIFHILESHRPSLVPSISCTRFFLHDLIIYGAKCQSFTHYHLLFILNLLSLILIISDGVSQCLYLTSLIIFQLEPIIPKVLLYAVYILFQIFLCGVPYYMTLSWSSTFLILYSLWIPTLCSISERNTLLFSSSSLGSLSKNLSFIWQCVFGIEAYFLFLGISVMEGVGDYGNL